MARRTTNQKGPTPVEATLHQDKRVNLPTADAQDFVTEEIEQPVPVSYERPLLYPRDPTADPQLVWKGKDEVDGEDLVAEAPAIYIQEKIDPRVVIENLRDTAARPEDEPELSLFETFDGLPELDLVDFYRHPANWSNRMILGDSLNVMVSLAEREGLRGKVQMIYVDPPYGVRFNSNWQASARKREVKDGKLEDASREVEQIKAFRDTWELGIHSYLTYLRDRLMAARDLLTESGSIFVQIGDENLHLVRSVMDEVFGSENFISQISFAKTTGQTNRLLAETSDYVLWYGRDITCVKARALFLPRSPIESPDERYVCVETTSGELIDLSVAQKSGAAPIPEGRIVKLENLTSQTGSDSSRFPVTFAGRTFVPSAKRGWSTNAEGIERLRHADYLASVGKTLLWKSYRDTFPFRPLRNSWADARTTGFGSEKFYVVQTNVKVVERCTLMTTDPGDLVLDPTCGSGTTAYVAEQWGRRWITIDTSRVALALARQRLMGAQFPYYLLTDSAEGRRKEEEVRLIP